MNPFKPTAGKMPPILIGRESVIRDFEEALDNGAGAPGRLMLISGQRGFGKTVMLTELGRVAKKHDWAVVSDTASNGLCERLVTALSSGGLRFGGATISPSVGVGGMVSASLGSVSISPSNAALTLRGPSRPGSSECRMERAFSSPSTRHRPPRRKIWLPWPPPSSTS